MTEYRRNFVKGGSYFFTVALADRSQRLLVDHVDSLRQAFRHVKVLYPFSLDAIVVLPEHLHCIWTLLREDANYPERWRRIKAAFSRSLANSNSRSHSKMLKGERGVWQRRYWEHTLRDEGDWQRHMDYIHYNPVKQRLVKQVADWKYSTFHPYVEGGMYPENLGWKW
ncbi:REP-associated tyrosine transposase [Nitrosovibrio sp. Nv4]|uniref:REP-associated tyrosine transposase n=1 Tax=Nitrosovibrio sp. Nv4 TaxID=1945880 RepID=UPI000BC52856|nr:transposase [Nitrosovibrio sp. Nv4]SOD40242.1 putative transposase [Nitrosovibrio sp. Nv4]